MYALLDILVAPLFEQHLSELLRERGSVVLHAEVEERASACYEDQQQGGAYCGRAYDGARETLEVGLFAAFDGYACAECRQQRQRPLCHHEGHRYGSELVVAGQVAHEQLGQPHHVASPRHEEREQCRRHDPPPLPCRQQEESREGEEYDGGAQIGGACGVGLVTPVSGHVLCCLLHAVGTQGLGYGAVRGEGVARGAAHEVGHEGV